MYSISLLFVWITFFVIVTSGDSSSSTDDGTYCGGTGWIAYRDEKCYKLIKQWATRDEAKDACAQEASDGSVPQLATIKSSAEQTYLTELVFETSAVKFNVWIGAKRTPGNNNFLWDDGSHLGPFTNWADSSPTEELEKECVVLQSRLIKQENHNSLQRAVNGKWRDTICDSVNYVICEKQPRWSFAKLQQTLLVQRKELDETKSVLNDTRSELNDTKNELTDTKTELTEKVYKLTNSLEDVSNKLDTTRQNPVPIGFIYVQLSGQPEPRALWSTVQWQDVTREYAGLFFRAEGGDSEQFGTVQEGNAPRVTLVQRAWYHSTANSWPNTTLHVGGWSSGNGVYSGSWNIPDQYTHQFYTSGGEVRPRNTAIRVWKRIS